MNVKNIFNSIVNIAGVSKSKMDPKAKTEASGDRDTQLGHGQEEAAQHRMTEPEARDVVEYLESLEGFKDNNLHVRLEKHEDRYVIFVEDSDGKKVRRIPESEMWFLAKKKHQGDDKKGRIINKAM